MSFSVGKSSNTRELHSETMPMPSSVMKWLLYDSRPLRQLAEWISAGTSNSTSFAYSGYQYSSPSGGAMPSPS